jgi:probable HAF family extracellular repeat protein
VVGFSSADCAVNSHAFLWQDGQIIDLNMFNHSGSGLQQLLLAYNINDQGEIAGLGVPPGVDPADVFTLGHTFVLIPCDDKHRDDESCEEGRGKNEVPQSHSAVADSSRRMPPPALSPEHSRYRGLGVNRLKISASYLGRK